MANRLAVDFNPHCLAVCNGTNCTRPDGKECEAGDTNCPCESFEFAICAALPAEP